MANITRSVSEYGRVGWSLVCCTAHHTWHLPFQPTASASGGCGLAGMAPPLLPFPPLPFSPRGPGRQPEMASCLRPSLQRTARTLHQVCGIADSAVSLAMQWHHLVSER